MSTYSKVDPSTLGWVKSEIDETLKQARLALESFAENPGDKSWLRFCMTHLHQVVGTLVMVELDGAALIAREAERLAEAVLNDKVQPEPAILDALSRSIVILPDYLARLQFGRPDIPLRHLPLVNELRAARGEPPLLEHELFTPDLSVRPPRAPGARLVSLPEEEYPAAVRRQRAAFQSALLDWLRDPARRDALARLGAVLDELQALARLPAAEQLFWVAGGLVEALSEEGLEATAERKKLFARIDQQIKRLADGSDRSELRRTCEDVTRAILWELAHARVQGERVRQLNQAFGLEALLAGALAEGTFAEPPSPEVLASVSQALSEEIERAQDLLATYFEPGHGEAATLEALDQILHRMGGTLEMLGVTPLKRLVDELVTVTQALRKGAIADPAAASMPMAEGLLLLETSTRDIPRSGNEWARRIEEGIRALRVLYAPEGEAGRPDLAGIEVEEAVLTEGELKQLLEVVGHEIGVNLARVEELLEGYAADTRRREALAEITPLLHQIEGALEILGQSRAVALTEAARERLEALYRETLAPSPAVLDALAVCIGTIGAYVDGLKSGRRHLDSLVDNALSEMERALAAAPSSAPPTAGGGRGAPGVDAAALSERLEAWLAAPGDAEAARRLEASLAELGQAYQAEDKRARIAAEMQRLVAMVAAGEAELNEEVCATLRQSLAALNTLEARHPAAAAAAPPPPPPPPVVPSHAKKGPSPDELDDDIMEIFIEDARDVLDAIRKNFETWRADKDDKEAFLELRRGYHTLKGSGRMVGATVISELAWAVENMLNRLRDGKIAWSQEIVELLARVEEALPALIDSLRGGPEPAVDVEALRAEADRLAGGGAVAPPRAAGAAAAAAPPAAGATPATVDDLPQLDGTLLEIFTSEARGHLDHLHREIAACRASGGCLVTETLFRATHTLAGNARSLSIPMMAEACYEVERLLHDLRAQNQPLATEQLDLLSALAETVAALIERLNRGETSSGDCAARFAEITHRARAESARLHARSPAAEDGTEPTAAAPSPPPPPPSEDDARAPAEAIAVEAPVTEEASQEGRETQPQAPSPSSPLAAVSPAAEDRIDPELIEIFREEAVDLIAALDETLSRWRVRPAEREALHELKRVLHTLKGGARMAGVFSMGNLAHATETLLKNVEDGRLEPSGTLFDHLDEVHDALVAMLDRLQQGRPLPDVRALSEQIAALAGGMPPPATACAPTPHSEPPEARGGDGGGPVSADPPPAAVAAGATAENETAAGMLAALADERREEEPEAAASARHWPESLERRGQIRVRTDLLNELVNYAGEVSISRARMEQKIWSFRDNLQELARNVARFREQIRELEIQSESQILYRPASELTGDSQSEFDPLEFDRYSRLQQLTRQLAESLHDLTTIQNHLGSFVGEAETVLAQQARLNTELQEGLMRTRMVSFATQAGRLRHIVRTTARELGKRVELVLEGAEVELDRTVLERMIGPFEHMIRNSIDHGIEPAEVRRRRGKPVSGRITISVAQEGTEIVIRFADDGAGLDIEAIRAKAIERGLMSPDTVMNDDELVQFILMPGFSTASQVTHVSGRGVGMDVVHNEVKQLGGSMSVDTKPGQGTTFIIRLPLTLSITQALMVQVADQLFAVPLSAVSNIIEVPVERIAAITVGKNPLLNWNEKVYPFVNLAARLGIHGGAVRNGKKVPVLIGRTGTREIAIQVDGLAGAREIVVKSLGPQLSEIKGLAGATILGDGRVVLILDIAGLWYREDAIHLEQRATAAGQATAAAAAAAADAELRARPLIMVVDDSLTVRKVTGKHLQKRGMEVMTAKDGVDAVEQLRERVPDLMLVDIEMPRMDGYELTQRVRGDERTRHVPIIMITSRAGAKHRQKALSLGVNLYMTKPYQEEELFKNIDALLRTRAARSEGRA